jgi:hypothetical protein
MQQREQKCYSAPALGFFNLRTACTCRRRCCQPKLAPISVTLCTESASRVLKAAAGPRGPPGVSAVAFLVGVYLRPRVRHATVHATARLPISTRQSGGAGASTALPHPSSSSAACTPPHPAPHISTTQSTVPTDERGRDPRTSAVTTYFHRKYAFKYEFRDFLSFLSSFRAKYSLSL